MVTERRFSAIVPPSLAYFIGNVLGQFAEMKMLGIKSINSVSDMLVPGRTSTIGNRSTEEKFRPNTYILSLQASTNPKVHGRRVIRSVASGWSLLPSLQTSSSKHWISVLKSSHH